MSLSTFDPLPSMRVASIRAFATGAMSTTSLPRPDFVNDDVDAPTEVEVKIAELSGKIDRLTDLLLAMQREKDAAA